ncbi:hypothetical protein [uncultured phage cr50_1]|uniref:Uncharacterized protein n=1 Tax=uncultured phage cr50_1 TaxID=2772059 RepID=A0A7M1RY87_9CAUD|nr:hypothetical protein KNV26_gp003 [uncultured phage cr50_1]QOR57980.1 hypothetical protein [uncultured phage cr50_1]
MDTVNYVNKVGKLVNDSTKYNVKLDRTSIENVVLISHFGDLVKQISADTKLTEEQKTKTLKKVNRYINCLKKQMNFYPEKNIASDCILTEVEEHIIQE